MDPAVIGAELNKVLAPSVVSSRAGANCEKMYYLPIGTARAIADDIFGPSNWQVAERFWDVEYAPHTDSQIHSVMVTCCVRVSLTSGAYREDIGFGEASGRFRGDVERQARAIAKADATKRCLRTFGNTLGNCLFYREYAQFADQ